MIILSGGLDSSVVAYQVKSKSPKKIKSIFFNYDQRTLEQEEFASRKISKNIEVSKIGKHGRAKVRLEVVNVKTSEEKVLIRVSTEKVEKK